MLVSADTATCALFSDFRLADSLTDLHDVLLLQDSKSEGKHSQISNPLRAVFVALMPMPCVDHTLTFSGSAAPVLTPPLRDSRAHDPLVFMPLACVSSVPAVLTFASLP